MRLTKFPIRNLLESRPRPADYLDLLRPCATRITTAWWEFDRDSPCYRKLEARFKEYVPTPEDWARFERRKAERRAAQDQRTRQMWAMLHRFCALPAAKNADRLAEFLIQFDRELPCGDCRRHWRKLLLELPPNIRDPFAWSVAAHNAINRRLKKREMTIPEARALWCPGSE